MRAEKKEEAPAASWAKQPQEKEEAAPAPAPEPEPAAAPVAYSAGERTKLL
jgi:hypothetical protein